MESTILTKEQLLTLTSISENMDVELLQPHLLIAQQLYVSPVLGDALYSDIVSKYDNNSITGDTLTLYNDYIVPAIAYAAWFSAAPFLQFKTQRNGIQTQASDNNTPVTVEELSLYINRVENLKNFYCERLNKYLIEDNGTKFPLFRQDNTPQTLSKGSSLYLGFKSKNSSNTCNGW